MADYIDRDAFLADKRKQYCADCNRRKGMKNGKMRFIYDIGDAPCRACGVDDMFGDIEDFPAADVVRDLRDCRNELCLRCGNYHDAHNGACDGCRWKSGVWFK